MGEIKFDEFQQQAIEGWNIIDDPKALEYQKIAEDYLSKTPEEFDQTDLGRMFTVLESISKMDTETLKEFGFYGYRYSTESEPIKIHQLLFLKAYALGNMEARELIMVDKDFDCRKSDFNKELELLLFDM